MSVRLSEEEMRFIEELSSLEKVDKSAAARDLVRRGWTFKVLQLYREGKMSLETAAKKLNLSMGEMIDLLAEFGVPSPVAYEDYLDGFSQKNPKRRNRPCRQRQSNYRPTS